MSITSASGVARLIRSRSSAPVATSSTANPSSWRPRTRTARSSWSSSTIVIDVPRLTGGLSFLPQDRADREPVDLRRGQRGGCETAEGSGDAETRKESPGRGEVIGWRVEHVLQHRNEHLGEEPAQKRRESERGDQHDRRFAPEEG